MRFWRRDQVSDELRAQWSNPADIFSLLLLIGGDIVKTAIAQQAGSRYPTPVVFSFGWVAYAFSALLAAVGVNRLHPPPDTPVIVLNAGSGQQRQNESWILGRLVRDFDSELVSRETRLKLEELLKEVSTERKGTKTLKAGLCVSVFEVSQGTEAGRPNLDFWWYSGWLVAIIQLGIAAIPAGVYGEWQILVICSGGTLLAFATASLPQWKEERYACRKDSAKTYIITRGNGTQHAIVIIGNGKSLDFEDLAAISEYTSQFLVTRLAILLSAVLWVALLISVSGINKHTWFLVAVGGIGMLHTVVIAGRARHPSFFGIHLTECDVFLNKKVLASLDEVEKKYPGIGRVMVPIFFPGGLRLDEVEAWKKHKIAEDKAKAERKAAKEEVDKNVTGLEQQGVADLIKVVIIDNAHPMSVTRDPDAIETMISKD